MKLIMLMCMLPLLAGCPDHGSDHVMALCRVGCSPMAAPEIDPVSAISAVTVLILTCLIMRGRK